jgi:hypothetical protein
MSTDGYFGGRSRLAGELRFNEGEPLAPELDRYRAPAEPSGCRFVYKMSLVSQASLNGHE